MRFGRIAAALLAALASAAPATAQTMMAPGSPAVAQGPGQDSPFLGSLPKGKLTSEPLQLSIKDAVQRALQSNLGLLLQEESETPRAAPAGAHWPICCPI